MKRSQLIVVLAAVVAVAVIGVVSRDGDDGQPASRGPANAVRVTVASSPEKLALMQAVAREFNASGARVEGRPVVTSVRSAASGDEEVAIARAARGEGGDRPVVWSPASSFWARLLEHDTDRALVPSSSPSIVRTPLVLAMWEPLARALGYPRKPIGFTDILRLARDRRGWGAYGHPEYGAFKLVHTNPAVSTSGLEAVSAEYFAATGKREGLTVADVDRPAVRRQIAEIEQSIVHYGDTTLFIEDQLRKHGPTYASAVAMEETTLVDFNRDRGGQPKLVGIYPAEGTFFSDSPYVILQVPWVDAAERAGALELQRFLAAHVTPSVAARYGFRPADPHVAPLPPVDAEHGADPGQPTRVLGVPEPSVLARVQRSWFENRKAANIALVVDTSGSMNDASKLQHAKQGLKEFLRELSPRDRVELIAFSDDVREVVPLQPYSRGHRQLRDSVAGLFADGNTALYDATSQAVEDIAGLRDARRINAVVLLSDGQDTANDLPLNALIPRLARHTGAEATAVRVFTIAYGDDADSEVLDTIAEASDGKPFVGGTEDIGAVYRSISSFF
jgi:Ca-activated chloride channel homolog